MTDAIITSAMSFYSLLWLPSHSGYFFDFPQTHCLRIGSIFKRSANVGAFGSSLFSSPVFFWCYSFGNWKLLVLRSF
jgi:hypothetical protein